MKTNKFNTISKILFLTMLFGYIIYIAVKSYNDKKERNLKSKYTIGIVIKISPLSKSGYNLKHIYKINHILYKSSRIIDEKENYLNKRFYVKFESDNPNNCEILLDKPVHDSIKEAPPEGWDKIPK